VTDPGSAVTLLRGQLVWFREQGWDVQLVAAPGSGLDEVARRDGVTTHGLPMSRDMRPKQDLLALLRWTRLLRLLRPDVVNLGTPKASLLGSVAAWLTRVPVRVYVMWGLRLEGARTAQERVLLWAAERLTVLMSTHVVCVSQSLREEASRRGVLGPRTRPIVLGQGSSNGVDPDRWDPALAALERDQVRAGWGVEPTDLVVGFVGRIAYDKGVRDLLVAVGQVAGEGIRLVLAGWVEDAELEAVFEELGAQVVWLGPTSDPSPVYAGIDVLCLPTRREGFPNVVLEAALAEVPTVTTTATGARDSVIPDVTGWLVPTGDVPRLADALRACAADRAAVREAGRAARERALKDFRPQAIWRGLESIYLGAWDGLPDEAGAPVG
jgi:glycosyltransferase involved in cell wall biosynthesis